MFKLLSRASFVIGVISIALLMVLNWIRDLFGGVSFGQLLWNITNPIDGVDRAIIFSAVKYGVYFLGLAFIWFWLTLRIPRVEYRLVNSVGQKLGKRIVVSCTAFFFLISLGLGYYAAHKINKQFSPKSAIMNLVTSESYTGEDYIAQLYSIPQNIEFSEKKNLVLIFGESLEGTFASDSLNLMPKLSALRKQGSHVLDMQNLALTGWTIAAFTGWSFGLPIKARFVEDLGNKAGGSTGFLPNAISVFDILKVEGYRLIFVMGSSAYFSGLNILLRTHGDFEIMDSNYWESKGWSKQDNAGLGWGFRDEFTFERAAEIYDELKNSEQPFVLIVNTIDTHSPTGYRSPKFNRYGDIRDSFCYSDEVISKFIATVMNKAPADPVLILGDHYLMGTYDFVKGKKRTIFNAFLGNIPKIPEEKTKQAISALDIAPSILQMVGAKWDNNQFGLGISVFSEEPSLVQKYGADELNRRLNAPSLFYQKLNDD